MEKDSTKMAKFREQFHRKFDKKQVRPVIKQYDLSICIELEGVTKQVSEEVGNEMVNLRYCESYTVEWNGQNDLWLQNVDLAFVTPTELSRTLANVLEMFDYEVIDIDFN